MIGDNRFVFVAPAFNASKTLRQMLHSLAGQSYDNWKLILIDDVSDDQHWQLCHKYLDDFDTLLGIGPSGDKYINYHRNTEKRWEVANVLLGISGCLENDIVCRIDADDWLCELDALMMVNHAYKQTNCDALWTAHRWGFSDKNISGLMADGVDPYKHPWVSSHLKTFRKYLLSNVKDENFRNESGNYVQRAGDQEIYLPALFNARKRVFLPRVVYHYTIDDVPATYQTTDARFQRDEALFLRARGYVR